MGWGGGSTDSGKSTVSLWFVVTDFLEVFSVSVFTLNHHIVRRNFKEMPKLTIGTPVYERTKM
jgi:hypothetical protein